MHMKDQSLSTCCFKENTEVSGHTVSVFRFKGVKVKFWPRFVASLWTAQAKLDDSKTDFPFAANRNKYINHRWVTMSPECFSSSGQKISF